MRAPRGSSDRLPVALVVGIGLALSLGVVWVPTGLSVVLSFTAWDGTGGLGAARPVGLDNYIALLSVDPAFGRAVANTSIWLAATMFIATPLGVLLAALLDRPLRGSALYESALYVPVILSLALVGVIWQLQYAPEQGFLNNVLGTTAPDRLIDWLGDRDVNLFAALVAGMWRHVGYVTLIYLAGLRSVDFSLREAAALDGASEAQTFRRVIFPVMRPVNALVLVIGAIEGLRAFDIVYVLNGGRHGLELLSVLVVNNLLGQASRIGYGSAVATVLLLASVVPIAIYLRPVMDPRRGGSAW